MKEKRLSRGQGGKGRWESQGGEEIRGGVGRVVREEGMGKTEGGRGEPPWWGRGVIADSKGRVEKACIKGYGHNRVSSKPGGREWDTQGFQSFSNFGILSNSIASILAWIMAWVILCFAVRIHKVEDFQAFAMVCLAAVVIWSSSLNWRWVRDMGLLFRRATIGLRKSLTRRFINWILSLKRSGA